MIKKCVLCLLVCLCSSVFVFGQSDDPPPWLGDVNGSETIDIIDALLTSQYYVGLTDDELIQENGDVNQDGVVDIIDALIIAQYYVGLMEYLPGDSTYGRIQKDLAKNYNKWYGLTFFNYQIELKYENSLFPYSEDTFILNVELLYYKISAFFKDTNEPADDVIDELITIDDLFTLVQEAIDQRYIIYDIVFDDQFGYVSRFNYEVSEELEDDLVTYEILNISGNRDIQITAEDPADIVYDYFVLYEPTIINDILLLPIQYNGGCNIPDISLYAQDVFLESIPVQANLYVYVNTFEDPCYSTPTEPGAFNLEPLAELYHSYYQTYDTIVLNIYGYYLDDPEPVAFSIPYTPVMTE